MNGRSAPPASAALTQELHDIIENDRYPLSPRIRTLRAILAKLRPEPVRDPRQAQAGAGSRAVAAAEAIRAGVERAVSETRLSGGEEGKGLSVGFDYPGLWGVICDWIYPWQTIITGIVAASAGWAAYRAGVKLATATRHAVRIARPSSRNAK